MSSARQYAYNAYDYYVGVVRKPPPNKPRPVHFILMDVIWVVCIYVNILCSRFGVYPGGPRAITVASFRSLCISIFQFRISKQCLSNNL